MRRVVKLSAALLLIVLLLLGQCVLMCAAESTLTYRGFAQGFDIQPGSGYSETDLFDDFKDVMPGDTLLETVTVKNESGDNDYIRVYLRAVLHDEEGNPLTYDERYEETDGKDDPRDLSGRDETVASMADFLSQLTMTVYKGEMKEENVLYQASPDQAGALAENVLLGALGQGQTLQLNIKLEVPKELGNEYARRVGEVDWLFRVESLDYPPVPSSGISVRKDWDDNRDKEGKRPDSIDVTLYKGNTAVETVTLSKENGWSHAWSGLERREDWSVVESHVPDGYYALYKRSGNDVTIINTTKLIQTGQLNWPIPVLAVLGVVLILMGIAAMRKKRKHDA